MRLALLIITLFTSLVALGASKFSDAQMARLPQPGIATGKLQMAKAPKIPVKKPVRKVSQERHITSTAEPQEPGTASRKRQELRGMLDDKLCVKVQSYARGVGLLRETGVPMEELPKVTNLGFDPLPIQKSVYESKDNWTDAMGYVKFNCDEFGSQNLGVALK